MPQLTRQVPDGAIHPGFNDSPTDTIPAKRLVTFDTTGKQHIGLATSATAKSYGVTLEDIPPLRSGDVQRQGKAILTAGVGGATIGSRITGGTSGKGIISTTDNHVSHGEAVTECDADEDFEILLTPGATVPG